jgi:hypothetical protein
MWAHHYTIVACRSAGQTGLVQAGHFPAERRPLQLHNAAQALVGFGGAQADAVSGLRPEALVDGDRLATLSFLWTLFLQFQVRGTS